jgi:hypothetical protein
LNTLQGTARDIPVPVKILDFPFPYTHENPFPLRDKFQHQVMEKFEEVFAMASDFLK